MRIALKRVVGAYVIVLLDAENPETIIAARKGSPLVIGIGKGRTFPGSDASPMIEYTKEVVYVNDYEMAIVKPDELILKNLGNEKITLITKLDMELAAIEKGGYEHFMLKEIFEQPQTIYDCLTGKAGCGCRNDHDERDCRQYAEQIMNANRIMIVACGTSWHAGLVAEYMIEELCRIPVEVEYASEFRYRNPVINKGDVIIAISQSGETADTFVAIENAKAKGAIILGVVNVVGSSIARALTCWRLYACRPGNRCGFYQSFYCATGGADLDRFENRQIKGTIDDDRYMQSTERAEADSRKSGKGILNRTITLKSIAEKYKDARDFLYLGRGYNFPSHWKAL